jgi:adenylate cyclase
MSSPGRLKRLAPALITLSITLLIFWAYFLNPEFLHVLELKTYDLRLKARGRLPVSGEAAVIAVDEKSLEEIGRWPWSRSVMADLVRDIDACAPRAVGFDISFFDPQKTKAREELVLLARNAKKLGLLPNPELVTYLKKRLEASSPDVDLARALAGSDVPHVLGYYFNLHPDAKSGENTLKNAAAYPVQKVIGRVREVTPSVPVGYKARTNIPLLSRAAHAQAFFNVIPDVDGTIRRYNLVLEHGGKYYAPLAAAVAGFSDTTRVASIEMSPAGIMGVNVGKYHVPADEQGRMLVDFRGPAGTIPTVPAWKVLKEDFSPSSLKGKYVLVGVSAPGVFDLRVTPVGVAYPGLEIQATVLDQILNGDYIARPNWAPLFDLAAVSCMGLLALLFLWRLNPVLSLAGFVAAGTGYVLGNYGLFASGRYWLSLVYPLLALICNYLALTVYRFMFADRQKRRIRKAFSKYLDPGVVEQVVANPHRLCLGGEKQNLSVLFSDIRGFTSISEELAPEHLVRLLNAYLTRMTRIITGSRGLVDKYIGDAVMAVFGAPLHYPEHAKRACRSALDMQSELSRFNREWSSVLGRDLDIGVGINTGEMVAGNMGSEDRFDYTVMGDHVNLASRLEGLNKQYGTRIIVSEYTREQAGEDFLFRSLDLVRVKGRERPVAIFELLGEAAQKPSWDYLDEYEEMIARYRSGEFVSARDMCSELVRNHPRDRVLGVYRERLEHLIASPPREWTGVYSFTIK